MINAILIYIFTYSGLVHAGDEWLCTTQASQRRSTSILACGVATAKDETSARAEAFKAAMDEFHRVCDNSIDCAGHEFQIMPERTQCEAAGSNEKCYRLLTVYIGHKFMPIRRIRTVIAEAVKVEVKREVAVVKTKVIKLRVGMSKAKLLALVGTPTSVSTVGDLTMMNYSNICQAGDLSCSVFVEYGKVTQLASINPEYLDLDSN